LTSLDGLYVHNVSPCSRVC